MAYTDNIIAEFDFEEGMEGVTSYGTPVYSVQTIDGKERKVINVSGGQLRADNLIADYVANRQSTDKMTISFWFKHNGGDSWIVSDMFGVGGGVQSYFRLTLDGRFSSSIRINTGLRAFNEWYLPSGGINSNGIPMQGYPTSHGTWHHVSMVYDETMENGAGQFIGDTTLYIDGVKTIGGMGRGYGGLGNGNGLDELVNAPHFTIGGRSVNDQVFNGELSHFVVHGRALDEAEINELMNALPGATPGDAFLHGFEDLKGFAKGKSSGSGVYMRKEAGETKFYVTPNVENVPSVSVSLGNGDFESIKRFSDDKYAVGVGGEVKIVSVSASSDSASVSFTIPNGGWSKAARIISNENWDGAGEEILLFDEDGTGYSIGPIENGVLTGTADPAPINIPAALQGSDTHVFDAAMVDGYLVVLGRHKDGGNPSVAVWDYQNATPVVLGNLPVSEVWEINYLYNSFDNSYSWIVSDGSSTHTAADLSEWA